MMAQLDDGTQMTTKAGDFVSIPPRSEVLGARRTYSLVPPTPLKM
jgi:hypothetical protein